MATIIDSYSETNADSSTRLPVDEGGVGQCFTGDGQKIIDCKFYLRRNNSPPGNMTAKIWSMTGTFGVDGNTGSLLATSDLVAASVLGLSQALVTFPFSGANQYVTSNGTRYVVTVEYSAGDASNNVAAHYDGSSGTHPGTWVALVSGTWTAFDLGFDFPFYVDGVPAAVDVTVNLTGVAGSPAIGTGTVTIGSVPVEPPVTPGGGTGAARTGMRLRPTEDKFVYLKGVSADPQVGQVMLLSDMQRAYEAFLAPVRKAQAQRPAEMPSGMRRLFKPVEKPIPPAIFVYAAPFPRLRSAVGTGNVIAHFEDIDEELMALLGVL